MRAQVDIHAPQSLAWLGDSELRKVHDYVDVNDER